MPEIIRVGSLSGGRESSGMDLALTQLSEKTTGKSFFDRSRNGIRIFADTGRDPKGRAMVDYLNSRGWKITIVQSKYGDIQDYYGNRFVEKDGLKGHSMPTRKMRDCSFKFKIMPITNYLRDIFGKKARFAIYYGFTISKKDVKRKERMLNPEYRKSYAINKFPLIDVFKYDRQHCTDLCLKNFGFVPDRSACDLCFEQTLKDWKMLYEKNPKRALEIMNWEQGSLLYKQYGYGLNRVPLDILFKQRVVNTDGQQLLFTEKQISEIESEQEFLKEIDPSCACMGDAGIFVNNETIEEELGLDFEDVGYKVLVDW